MFRVGRYGFEILLSHLRALNIRRLLPAADHRQTVKFGNLECEHCKFGLLLQLSSSLNIDTGFPLRASRLRTILPVIHCQERPPIGGKSRARLSAIPGTLRKLVPWNYADFDPELKVIYNLEYGKPEERREIKADTLSNRLIGKITPTCSCDCIDVEYRDTLLPFVKPHFAHHPGRSTDIRIYSENPTLHDPSGSVFKGIENVESIPADKYPVLATARMRGLPRICRIGHGACE